jgi:hypothetical protein
VPATVQNKTFGKPSLSSGFTKSLCHRSEVGRLRTLRWENPSFAPRAAPPLENPKDPVAHGYPTPTLFGLAVRHKDDSVVPIQILNAYPSAAWRVLTSWGTVVFLAGVGWDMVVLRRRLA